MESEIGTADDRRRASSALRELDADRSRLGEQMRAPAWYGPLCGLLVAALLLTPLVPAGWWAPVPVVLGVAAGLGLRLLYRRAVGVTTRGVAGPLSTAMAVVMVGGVLALYCAAWLSTGSGMPLLVVALAVSGFALMWGFVVLNDRAVAWDLRHAG
jgi:hypothetical protein